MLRNLFIVILGFLLCEATKGEAQDLAHLLASEDDGTRQASIASIVSAGQVDIPLLLSWTRNPPTDLNFTQRYDLSASLAEIFGRLMTKEAIPFLLENLDVRSSLLLIGPNIWQRPPEVIEARMPAVRALIRIGPAALDAIVHSPVEPSAFYERLARIFVVSRIVATLRDPKLLDDAHNFLRVALAEADTQRFWADRGLKNLDSRAGVR